MSLISCSILVLLSLFAIALAGGRGNDRDDRTRDVCIIGGGAAGMSSAVFLKDRGYDVVVFEIASNVGGHCNTVRSGAPNLAAGYPGYVDIGVVVYQDTDRAIADPTGIHGQWSLGSRTFASRFGQLIDLDFTQGASTTSFFDFNLGIPINVPPPSPESQQAVGAAIGRIYAVTVQYPWLNTGKRPASIPAFMLRPFTEFIAEHQLEVLVPAIFVPLLSGAGMGSLERLTTLEALQVLAPVTLDLFTTPGAGFTPLGGCQTLYENMADYIGRDNIKLQSDVQSVRRTRNRVYVSGYTAKGRGFHNGYRYGGHRDDNDRRGSRSFTYSCKKLIVGFYPLIWNLDMLDLTWEERALFSQLEANYYLAMAVNVTGGSLVNQPFQINNWNASNPLGVPSLPFLSALSRDFAAGPLKSYVNADSENPIPLSRARQIALDAFAKIQPSGLLTGFDIIREDYHYYDPHFKVAALSAQPSADTRFTALQGKQNTYWVGAATRYDASAVVWNQAYELVDANFPSQK